MRTSEKVPGGSFPDRRPLYYYITDRGRLPGMTLIRCVSRAVRWGVDFVQVREKDLDDRELFDLVVRIVRTAAGTACRIMVNGRADVALAAGAHGVHLPGNGIDPALLRPRLPPGFLVGVSTHSLREVRRAAAAGADYVLFGPVFPTESKLRYGPPLGLGMLRRACAAVRIPVIALGGMRLDSLPAVIRAGAAGIAGIGMFQQPKLPRARRGFFLTGGHDRGWRHGP